jgi:hypothetical protein
MSLISLIPKREGIGKSVSVTECFDCIDGSSKVEVCSGADKILVAFLKLTGAATAHYSVM